MTIDLVTRSVAKSLAIYVIGSVGVFSWHDYLYEILVVNKVSNDLQSKDMHINVVIEQVQGLIAYDF